MLPDVFSYFEGGREGIKQRLAEQIREGVATHKMSWADLDSLEHEIKCPARAISRILDGDLSELNADLAEDLACCLGLDFGTALGEWKFNEGDRQVWEEEIKHNGFISVGSAPVEDMVRVFTTLRALTTL